MRFTPVLIVYLTLLMILIVAMKELNKCTVELQKHQIKIQEQK